MEKAVLNTLQTCQVTDRTVLMHLGHLLVLLTLLPRKAPEQPLH